MHLDLVLALAVHFLVLVQLDPVLVQLLGLLLVDLVLVLVLLLELVLVLVLVLVFVRLPVLGLVQL